jgi:hypothetical protein
VTTEPTFIDVTLPTGGAFRLPLPPEHNALLYLFEGRVRVGEGGRQATMERQQAAVLSSGDAVAVRADGGPARLLLLAARPLAEPVVQYGPFVMNTREEIEQALDDYRTGRLG